MATPEQQQKLQALSDQYQDLQSGKIVKQMTGGNDLIILLELQGIVAARQKLESQQQENKNVQKVCHHSSYH